MQDLTKRRFRCLFLAVACLVVAGIAWFLFNFKNSVEDAKSEKSSAQKVSGPSVPTDANNSQASNQSKDGLLTVDARQSASNDLFQKLSVLASSAGMTEEVERVIHDIATLGDRAVPELGRLIQVDQNANVRNAAARALAEIGTRESISTLLEAVLSEQDTEQRRALVSSLYALNNPAPAEELVDALLKSQDHIVFPTVRDTLARVADSTAARTIAESFHSNAQDGWQQSNLMGALLRISSEDAVPALREILIQDPDFSLRSQAAIALGRIGNPEAIQSLLNALAEIQSTALQQVLVESLGAVNNKASLNALAGILNQSTNAITRSIAARALGNIPNESSANALRSALDNETSQPVRQAIAASLSRLAQANSSQTN